ncbi:MAG TPA: hypothetical protein DIW64_14380 [Cellvibrio sp.]|nr:hypothetical protein [Cellvibrio sp.]
MIDEFQTSLIHYLKYDYNHLIAFLVSIAAAWMAGRTIYKDQASLLAVLKKYSTLIWTAIAVVAFLISQYLYSPTIESGKLGGPEEFGQFGDYIGGILNPVFGFLTVILLLQSLSVQHNDLNHNQTLRRLESLTILLQDSIIAFDEKMDSEVLEDEQGKFSYRSAFFSTADGFNQKRFENTRNCAEEILNGNMLGRENLFISYHIQELISLCNKVISTHAHIIQLEEFPFIRSIQSDSLISFTDRAHHYRLITEKTAINISNGYGGYANHQ